MSLLRPDLLADRRIVVTSSVGGEVTNALEGLGADVEILRVAELPPQEEQVGEWARAHRPVHALVHSASSTFGGGGEPSLLAALDEAWTAVREVAVGALIESEEAGKLVLLGPRADAGPFTTAACAGLESLARTLSVEWARYGVTSVFVAPAGRTNESDVAELVAFLVSEAGRYLSGCRLDLGGAS